MFVIRWVIRRGLWKVGCRVEILVTLDLVLTGHPSAYNSCPMHPYFMINDRIPSFNGNDEAHIPSVSLVDYQGACAPVQLGDGSFAVGPFTVCSTETTPCRFL